MLLGGDDDIAAVTGDADRNNILVEKFLGGPKNNQLLNATCIYQPLDIYHLGDYYWVRFDRVSMMNKCCS
jgi:hypothetical protein